MSKNYQRNDGLPASNQHTVYYPECDHCGEKVEMQIDKVPKLRNTTAADGPRKCVGEAIYCDQECQGRSQGWWPVDPSE